MRMSGFRCHNLYGTLLVFGEHFDRHLPGLRRPGDSDDALPGAQPLQECRKLRVGHGGAPSKLASPFPFRRTFRCRVTARRNRKAVGLDGRRIRSFITKESGRLPASGSNKLTCSIAIHAATQTSIDVRRPAARPCSPRFNPTSAPAKMAQNSCIAISFQESVSGLIDLNRRTSL